MSSPIRHLDELPLDPVKAGTGTVRQVLTGPGEGSGFHMRRFVMEPGGGMPRHTNTVEHQQYVLRGTATIGIGDETYRVHAGDVLHIPGGTPHWYRAEGDEPFEFLCVVPDDEDHITILGDAPATAAGESAAC
jgi:quercetin dioxygenase-like cupin family protein